MALTVDMTLYADQMGAPVPEELRPFACGVCQENRATHVLTAIDDPQADMFCSACIIITFAKIASEIGATEG